MRILKIQSLGCVTLLRPFLREQRERVQPPGEIDLRGEEQRCLPDTWKLAGTDDERVDSGCELRAASIRVQVDGERLHGTIVDLEPAMRIASGGEEQERAPPRLVQLPLRKVDSLAGEIGDDRQRVAELPRLEPVEDLLYRIHTGIMNEPRHTRGVKRLALLAATTLVLAAAATAGASPGAPGTTDPSYSFRCR